MLLSVSLLQLLVCTIRYIFCVVYWCAS